MKDHEKVFMLGASKTIAETAVMTCVAFVEDPLDVPGAASAVLGGAILMIARAMRDPEACLDVAINALTDAKATMARRRAESAAKVVSP